MPFPLPLPHPTYLISIQRTKAISSPWMVRRILKTRALYFLSGTTEQREESQWQIYSNRCFLMCDFTPTKVIIFLRKPVNQMSQSHCKILSTYVFNLRLPVLRRADILILVLMSHLTSSLSIPPCRDSGTAGCWWGVQSSVWVEYFSVDH